MVVLFIIAILMSFLLSGLETAVLSVSRVRVRHAADAKDKRAAQLLPLLDDRDGLLGALTIANHIANVAAFGYILWIIVRTWDAPGYLIGFLVALPLFIIGLEVLPKNLFRRYPFRALTKFLPILQVAACFRGFFKTIPTPTAITEEEANAAQLARDDLSRLMDDMVKSKQVPTAAAEIAKRVLSTRPLTARSVMIPLGEVASVSADSLARDAAETARERDFSYLLVTDGPGNKILGVLPVTSLPTEIPPDRQARQHTKNMESMEANLPALSVLQKLRRKGMSLAIVTEPATHQPIGMITEEDIIGTLLKSNTSEAEVSA